MFNVWNLISVPADQETTIADPKNFDVMYQNVEAITPVYLTIKPSKVYRVET